MNNLSTSGLKSGYCVPIVGPISYSLRNDYRQTACRRTHRQKHIYFIKTQGRTKGKLNRSGLKEQIPVFSQQNFMRQRNYRRIEIFVKQEKKKLEKKFAEEA